MLAANATTQEALLKQHEAQYYVALTERRIVPFVWPFFLVPPVLCIAYLSIDQQKYPFIRAQRHFVFAVICSICFFTIFCCRSPNPRLSYVIGLESTWAILWAFTLMIYYDPQKELKRVNWRKNGSPIEFRKVYWESFPMSSFSERFGWVMVLALNLTGQNWTHSGPTIPPLPDWVQQQLQEEKKISNDVGSYTGPTGNVRYRTRKELFVSALKTCIFAYIGCDIAKTIILWDPYFRGFFTESPPIWLPDLIYTNSHILRFFRLGVGFVAILASLQGLFALTNLFFVVLAGREGGSIYSEPWMWVSAFGSAQGVLDHGLSGFWAGYWHQVFRVAFESIAKFLIVKTGVRSEDVKGRLMRLFVSFILSGFLHGCGSYTLWPPTHPVTGSFMFFFLQPFGIILQLSVTVLAKRIGIRQRVPKFVRRVLNLSYVTAWLLLTSPLFIEDLARGGVWMYEPFPISLSRGFGFGPPGSGWYCWSGRWFEFYKGEHWWDTGLVLF